MLRNLPVASIVLAIACCHSCFIGLSRADRPYQTQLSSWANSSGAPLQQQHAWESSALQRLPQVCSPDSHAPESSVVVCSECDVQCDEQDYDECPNYAADCLEKLGWNKASGWRIVPFGFLRGEAIYSSARTVGDAVYISLAPRNVGIDEDIATVHAKTSQLNFLFTGPNVGDWQTGGLVVGNFLGAAPLRNFSGYNILNAYGEIKNEDWRFAFGRMLDLFGPIAPTTVQQLQQRGAGDIGIYRGVLHLDRYLNINDQHQWTFSVRASQQDISDYASVPSIRGKDNGWPNVESRIGLQLGPECDMGRPVEIGISAVWGELQAVADQLILDGLVEPGLDEVAQTRGVCLDLQLKGDRLGCRGEVWWGQAAGTYFVAALQSLNPETDQAIESVGGWCEVYLKVNPCVTLHVGYGVDDPRDADLGFVDRANCRNWSNQLQRRSLGQRDVEYHRLLSGWHWRSVTDGRNS